MVLQGAIRVTAVLQRVVVGCHCGPPRRRWWRSVTVGCRCGTLLVLQRNTVGPPKGHRCRIVTWVSPWSSKGTLLVLQRVSSVTVVLQGGIVGPPRGHWCCIVTIGCQTWSSKGRTLLVLQRDVDCHWSSKGMLGVTVVLQRDIVGPPEGLWVSVWSSNGTLLVLQRDIGVMSSLLGVTVVLQRGIDVTVVLQGDIVGPPKGCWMSLWSSSGTLLVLQRGFGCQCGPPTGH